MDLLSDIVKAERKGRKLYEGVLKPPSQKEELEESVALALQKKAEDETD